MFRPLTTAVAAVLGLSTLAGCHHFHHDPAPVYTPVVEAPAPAPQPTFDSKYH